MRYEIFFILVVIIFSILTIPGFSSPDLKCFPESIKESIYPGNSVVETFSIWQEKTDEPFNVQLSPSIENPQIKIDVPTKVVLVPKSPLTNRTNVVIFVFSDATEGTYDGTLFINHGTQDNCVIPIRVDVSKQTIIHVKGNLASRSVALGETLFVTINVEKEIGPPGPIDVSLTYKVKDPTGKIIDSKLNRLSVENTRNIEYNLNIPENGITGDYIFEIVGQYGLTFDASAAIFQVVSSKTELGALAGSNVIFYAVAVALIIFSLGATYSALKGSESKYFMSRHETYKKRILNQIKSQVRLHKYK